MKLSLGIDFNETRLNISAYNKDTHKLESLYNQAAIAFFSGTNSFGDECLENINHGQEAEASVAIKASRPDDMKKMFNYALALALDKLNSNDEIDYVVYANYYNGKDVNIFKSFFNEVAIKRYEQLQNAKLIVNTSSNLINILSTYQLEQLKKEDSSNIVVLNLSDASYDFSLFSYKKGSSAPYKLDHYETIKSFGRDSSSLFGDVGLFSFYSLMIDKALMHSSSPVLEARLKKNHIRYKAILDLQKYLDEHNDFYLANERDHIEIKIYARDGRDEQVSLYIEKADYDAAVDTILYDRNDSLWNYLCQVKEKLANLDSYKIICYGSFFRVIDVYSLVLSIFDSTKIIREVSYTYNPITNYNQYDFISKGGAVQSSLQYSGKVPVLSYKDYLNNEITILKGNENLMLSSSENGTIFYMSSKEYVVPLSVAIRADELSENKSIITVNQTQYDLNDYLYDSDGMLKSSSKGFSKNKDVIIARLQIGLIKDDEDSIVLFSFYDPIGQYSYEFELKKEGN